MIITRMQVEEGFLNGLDLRLVPGLNVLIGARGTGKTSVIELIRFALGVPASTSDLARKSLDHARSVLGSGQVTLKIEAGSAISTAVRTSDDDEPRFDGPTPTPIVFSQSEIEQVGLLQAGRLRIVDDFIKERDRYQNEETKAISDVRSATAELSAAYRQLAEIEERLTDLPAVAAALDDAVAQEASLASTSKAALEKTEQLDGISQRLAAEGVRDEFLERATQTLAYWIAPLSELVMLAPMLEEWQGSGDDPLADIRIEVAAIAERVVEAAERMQTLRDAVSLRRQEITKRRLPIEEQARGLRLEIDAIQEGAGQVTRKTAQLRERKAQLDSLQNHKLSRLKRLEALRQRRAILLNLLESIRQRRFKDRQGVATSLNRQLGPRINVTINHAGDPTDYNRVVVEALRGSGLRYTGLAAQLTQSLTPRELLEAAELNDYDHVANVAGITRDRAIRLLSHLRETELDRLAACYVEDEVNFHLLDGGDYKDLSSLSTGQRCTIVLPILLEHRDRILILDQPEDHIDNAFIADTIIRALLNRSPAGQVIISTHNANIPVLGNADLVVHLGSDGRLGYVKHAAELEAQETIDAITSLMEGGRAAFEQRASVYSRY